MSTGGEGATAPGSFSVRVSGFEGPFDLLLALIAKHRIEVTELALHVVTDDFIAHVRAQGPEWDLDEATAFLVIAATLLDLKAARLLPDGSVEDEEDLALLEARDLIFARLLQYRAYKEVAALLDTAMAGAARWHPREVGLEPWLTRLLPEVELGVDVGRFARIAQDALAPRPPEPAVPIAHIHVQAVDVPGQAALIVSRLRLGGTMTFQELIADAAETLIVVGRFLALLDLYREGAVNFEQDVPLGVLSFALREERTERDCDDEEKHVSSPTC
jgi:segregation and condensation protein A